MRKARIGVIAPTYRRLWDQVIPSYKKEIDPNWGIGDGKAGFKGARGDPADHVFIAQGHDGVKLHVEVLFRAVGEIALEDFFRGFEVTAWWLPEMDTHESEDLLSFASNRVGRYPEPDDRPDDPDLPTAYAGVWGDANAPVIGSWFHKRFWLKTGRMAGDAVFIQPSGLSPDHENRDNLRKIRRDYYQHLATTMELRLARRFVENRPGHSRHGLPVHDQFDDQRMVTEARIDANPNLPLWIGADCGNTLVPAAVFLQRAFGQVRALGEVVPVGQMDIVEFAREVRRLRETRFAHVTQAVLVVDPSAITASATNRQTTFAQILQAETNIEVFLAPSNDPLARRSALDQVLKRSGPPGEPGFVVSGPDCPGLVAALAGGYCFAKRGDKSSETPAKVHPHCDVAEAGQYGVLGMEGLGAAVAGGFIPEAGGHADAGSLPPILQD